MNFKFPKLITAMAVFVFTSGVFAEDAPKYDYNEAFKPFFYPTAILLWIEENGYSDAYIKRESTRGKVY